MTDTPSQPPEAAKPTSKPPIDPAFVEQVKKFLSGEEATTSTQSKSVLFTLKEVLADQASLTQELQKNEQALREGQTKLAQIAGKVEALVGVLKELETANDE